MWNPSSVGASVLGIMVGYLVRYFVYRFESFTPAALSAVVAVIGGGAALRYFFEVDKTARSYYLIGLFVGFVLWTIAAFLGLGPPDVLYLMWFPPPA